MAQFASIGFALALAASAPAQERTPASRPAAALTVTVPEFPNKTCAIMGKPVSTKLFVDTEKGRIYMCCKACTKAILADVKKAHQTAYPVVKRAENTTCAVMGDKIVKDSPTVVVQGYEVPVCCDGCIKDAQENAQVVLALITNPKAVDVGNETCPITGKPVEKNTFCLIGDHLVHLSAPECVDEVKKDPVKALARAREIQAAQPKPEKGRDAAGRAPASQKAQPEKREHQPAR